MIPRDARNIQLTDMRLIHDCEAHKSWGSNQRRPQRSAFSTYKLEAGPPVTKMMGFRNKINNQINLTIIYRYASIDILQSAISRVGENHSWSAAAGGSDEDDVLT